MKDSAVLVVCILLACAIGWVTQSPSQQPDVAYPDPTYEMVGDNIVKLRVPGFRTTWSRLDWSGIRMYEPGTYIEDGPKPWSLYIQLPNGKEWREDFDTRVAAEAMVQFMLDNTKEKK